MRLIVTGQHGQVAQALRERAGQYPEISVISLGRPQLDLENASTIYPALAEARPDFIVNAAAYTAVDKAESEPGRAFSINRDGAAAVAAAARRLAVPFIHLSTDYVFSGDKETAYVESDLTGPLGVYGKSKLAGELAVRIANPDAMILRTSWVYSPFGSNFVVTMLRLSTKLPQLRVVDDQVGNPTNALDLADAMLLIAPHVLAKKGSGRIFHIAGTGSTSWYKLANKVLQISKVYGGPNAEVVPISTVEYPTLAARPANSRLDMSAFATQFGFAVPPWQDRIEDTVRRLMMKVI